MTQFSERLEINNKTKTDILYNEHLVRYLLVKELAKDKVVLDVACGSGYGSQMLSEAGAKQVIAVDQDAKAFSSELKSRKNIEFIKDNAETLEKITDQSIDLAVSFETIEHLQDQDSFLKNLKRVLKPFDSVQGDAAGIAVISTPNREVFGNKNPFHIKELTKEELEDLCKRYFRRVEILEQYNALCSVIPSGHSTLSLRGVPDEAIPSSQSGQVGLPRPNEYIGARNDNAALYFIAVCSDGALPQLSSAVSVNPAALKKLYSNPGWKLAQMLYKFIKSIKSLKSVK